MINKGFKIIKYDKSKLKPYDIYIGNKDYNVKPSDNDWIKDKNDIFGNKFQKKDLTDNEKEEILKNHTHHCEIYAGNGKSYAWGKLYDGKNDRKTMPVDMADRQYDFIIRYDYQQ